jgi:hypothetical protein
MGPGKKGSMAVPRKPSGPVDPFGLGEFVRRGSLTQVNWLAEIIRARGQLVEVH